nr:uncharacterized protein LOC121115370 [Lepeophtheirus salmonis]
MSRGTKRICAVRTCKNPPDVHYFCFPKHGLKLQRLWVSMCKRSDKVNIKNARVCERHFSPEDFERNLQAELLKLKCRKKLKKGAFPSCNISGNECIPTKIKSDRDRRKENKERKIFVEEILKSKECLEHKNATEELMDTEPEPEPMTKTQCTQVDISYQREKGIQCKVEESFFEQKCKKLERELIIKNKKLSQYKAKCNFLNSNKYKHQYIKTTLEKNYSKAQVRRILNPKTKYNRGYSQLDVITAFILRNMSSKAFEYLRSRKIFALPSRQTQEQFLKDFKFEPGFLEECINNLSERKGA